MAQNKQWGLVGAGNVGGEIAQQIGKAYVSERLGLEAMPSFVMRSSGLTLADGSSADSFDGLDKFPDVTFVAVPSSDTGEPANALINTALERGSLVVTAEKGALANNFEALRDKSSGFSRLGINATVGGGTRMLDVAESWCRDPENVTEIHLALNGTLSAIMSMVGPQNSSAISLGRAVEQAVKLGYAEPGQTDAYEVIRGEAVGDIPKKTAILFNKLGLGQKILGHKDLNVVLTDDAIQAAYEEAKVRRFIVSLYAKEAISYRGPETDIYGGFDVDHDGWRIVAGFRNVNRNPLFNELARINGPGAGIVVGLGPNESDGIYHMTGDGAGAAPTANAMIDDYVRLSNTTINRGTYKNHLTA